MKHDLRNLFIGLLANMITQLILTNHSYTDLVNWILQAT